MDTPIKFLLERFEQAGQKDAIIWKERSFSYTWLYRQIQYWSQQLNDWGIRSGDIVMLEADFSPNSMALFLALVSARTILVPLTDSVQNRKTEFIEIAESEFCIRIDCKDDITFSKLNHTAKHSLYLEIRKRNVPGLVLFSSGSTGKSKAMLHDFRHVLTKFHTMRPSRRTITFLLYDHIGGINTMLHTLSNQACIVTVQQRDPDHVLRIASKYDVQVLPASPTFLNLILIGEDWQNHDLSKLELVTYGTEPMPESTLKRFHAVLPHVRLLQTYGLSEVGILRSKSRASDSLWFKVGGEGFETRVVDGLLEIRARSAMLGYLNASNPFTEDGWFQTRDEVEVDGEWIRILGRRSEIINVGGEKVYPAEIEGILQQMGGVVDAVVRGEPNSILGMVVHAKVQLSTNETVKKFRKRMEKYCQPRLQYFQIPVKIDIIQANLHGARFKKIRK